MKRMLLLFFCALLLTSCGQTGRLYLPHSPAVDPEPAANSDT